MRRKLVSPQSILRGAERPAWQAVDRKMRTPRSSWSVQGGWPLATTTNFATDQSHLTHTTTTTAPHSRPLPDLSLIENCWRAVKQYIRANFTTGADIIALAKAGWARITKAQINGYVDSMVRRMEDVLVGEGRMTGW